ncbi:hypothetical protein KIV56_16990 [Cryobacterium breve]|uniref:DUF2384 domain-containing protein n=1 Tax=Cryobacterium breve TaxID=1259258 RepID=A0ABY7NCW9_9MICO|nr:hypothetical protein [Cryobacterium breve]WBM79842.1 hypothetical protein KIV56_16990 [Cryobacterium breve]
MRAEIQWRDIEATWGLLTTDEVLEVLKIPAGETGSVDKMRKNGAILAVRRGSVFVFPGFQFVAGRVEPVIVQLIALAVEVRWSLEELVIWLCSPSGYFGGDRPINHLHPQNELLEKARDEATVEW